MVLNGGGVHGAFGFDHHASNGVVPVGRDVSTGGLMDTSAMASGLKRSMDGSNAAYDMKSLGKHIEAVSHTFISTPIFNPGTYLCSATYSWPTSYQKRRP